MRLRTTAAAGALLALALTACSSTDDKPDTPASTTATATSSAAAAQACEDAWTEAMESSKGTALPEDPPGACSQLPDTAITDLWLKAEKAWRARARECTTDPSCTLLPQP